MSGQKRRVALEVITRDLNHCSNDCPFMQIHQGPRATCVLFEHRDLHWDLRRKVHGYKRAPECQVAEIREEEF